MSIEIEQAPVLAATTRLNATHQAEQQSTPTTLQGSQALLSRIISFPRDTRACIVFDPRHATEVCFGSVQLRTNVRLSLTCQQLLLQVQWRVFLTPRHTYSHRGNVCKEYADHAAALLDLFPAIM